MSKQVVDFFTTLWHNYVAITPSAKQIHEVLGGGAIVNDHVAFRTFNLPQINLEVLGAYFVGLGYEEKGQYDFEAKKLKAKHFEHSDSTMPKVFISELLLEQCSEDLNRIVQRLVSQMSDSATDDIRLMYSGRHWDISYADYEQLLSESEYAAWTAAFGFRANHFTVSVNHLDQYSNLHQVNQVLKEHYFALNSAGGVIKGSPEVMLEQSSTLADKVLMDFSDQPQEIPGCFYEFAYRYPMVDGTLYQGFVAASADKIFESTHRR